MIDHDTIPSSGRWAQRAVDAMAVAFLVILASNIASAHHGFSGSYDLSRPIWIEGTVVASYFGQPHAELTIRTPADLAAPSSRPDLAEAAAFLDAGALAVLPETRGRTIKLELPPTQQYFGLGPRVALGDRIAAVAVRNCERPHQLNVQWLRLADGEIVARSGAMNYMVKSC